MNPKSETTRWLLLLLWSSFFATIALSRIILNIIREIFRAFNWHDGLSLSVNTLKKIKIASTNNRRKFQHIRHILRSHSYTRYRYI